ncbi:MULTISPECIES: ABC transporter ATP-binding protein [unclassified Modicisalibacter]|uniref:ABC transporter ATP-binding protein n=1 Tax=unclassified Modicisalibacter TaxID=2679913 RepID=UPI001CCCC953|nr:MULTISPECIES: ABC transporter ATP-binding protein [unclassified Modicisalibacter]MBZ9559836.1 ABC transporter ATP-binding protein [Modicisalibacter sp. R2A 31.J]MBZ9577288.1 ABC transporter ATP-binding protein [Modicisalibacter sp. MOD 31.J]
MIRIDNVSKTFGGLQAVRGVSFDVAQGSITGLIGPNGAGKSTLFNMVAGLFPPSSGRVLLDDEDITGLPPHKLFHRGLVRTFQIPHEFSRMTVRENLMVVPPSQSGENLFKAWLRWGRVKDEDSEVLARVDEVLDFLEITHVADELAGNLSGGQKKLLDLGRTMMTDAKMVLLDEPGAGVNRTLLGKIREAILRLNRERGYTFCVIEHDMDLISALCDPVHVMANGELIASGAMEDLRRNEQVREAYLGGGASGRMGENVTPGGASTNQGDAS